MDKFPPYVLLSICSDNHVHKPNLSKIRVSCRRLREIFQFLQDEVSQRFPNEEGVRYTAVSGFIFLRFFAPAILGPKLFGFEPGKSRLPFPFTSLRLSPTRNLQTALTGGLDARAIRTLTLSAKVLQGLANLVEFGQKEAFMTPMNGFIAGRIEGMKRFIDEISVSDVSESVISTWKVLIVHDFYRRPYHINKYTRRLIQKSRITRRKRNVGNCMDI